jgi:hypothetical protein
MIAVPRRTHMTGGTNQQFMIVANHEKAGVYSVHDLYNQRSAIGAIEERKGGRNITYVICDVVDKDAAIRCAESKYANYQPVENALDPKYGR